MSGTLAESGDGPTFRTFDGGDPYGLCTYRSPRDGAAYVFVTDRTGAVEQYRLDPPAENSPMTLVSGTHGRNDCGVHTVKSERRCRACGSNIEDGS